MVGDVSETAVIGISVPWKMLILLVLEFVLAVVMLFGAVVVVTT